MKQKSNKPGKGAIPYNGGVTFRTWAPFAKNVYVKGDFNQQLLGIEMFSEADGWWSCDVDGARPGQKYLFNIEGDDKIDPYAKEVTSSIGNGIIVSDDYLWKCNNFIPPEKDELVIYEMHIGTYPDEILAKNQMLSQVLVGTEIKHLKDLGVNAVELLPMHQFAGDESWGYNPACIFAIEEAYGGANALKRFVDTMHTNGIAVILDVVYSHFGPQDLGRSLWRYDGWGDVYENFVDYKKGGNEDAIMGGVYFYNDWRAETPWGHKNRPDYGRPEVRSFIKDNAIMWLDEYRFDGLRFDSTINIRNAHGRDDVAIDDPSNLGEWGLNMMSCINDEIKNNYPKKIIIAEDIQNNQYITKEISGGGVGFDSQWDIDFNHAIKNELVEINDDYRDVFAIKQLIEHKYNNIGLQRIIYTESHDEVAFDNGKTRLTAEIDPSNPSSIYAKKRSTLAAAILFTTPGIPMIFQGQEILDENPFKSGTRVDWSKCDENRGIYNLYRDLIRLRRNWFNNTRGLKGNNVNVFHSNPSAKVIAYHRWCDGSIGGDVIVVINLRNCHFKNYYIGFPRKGLWNVRFNSDSKYYDSEFSDLGSTEVYVGSDVGGYDGLSYKGKISIAPYSAIIFSQ